MATTTLTPNMNLIVPTVGTNGDPGPDYANNQNQDLSILDSHNHGPGSGVPVTPTGLNINANLSFNNNNATNIYGVQFSSHATSTLLTFLYTAPQSGGGINDLFYNDGAGNVIPLTKAGEVNATIASLPGESFSGGTFTWKQGAGSTTPANFDIGSITIRPNTAGTTNGVVLGPPSGISSLYNLQLPPLPVSATSFLTIDTSGNMAPGPAVIGALTTSNLSSSAGILGTQIAAQTITQTNKEIRTVSSTVGAGGVAISASSGLQTNSSTSFSAITFMTVTITTLGNPVEVFFQAVQSSSGTTSAITGGGTGNSLWAVSRNGTIFAIYELGPSDTVASSVLRVLDTPAAGTYTYIVSNRVTGGTCSIVDTVLVAYEL